MKLLAVETATPACSAALLVDGEILEKYELAPREHTKLILPMIDSLMAEAGLSVQQLDGLAFGRGPGSFTGVRIATGVIHGIALGADLPVAPISTLASIAQDFFNRQGVDCVLAAMDARMREIFFGAYKKNENGLARLLQQEQVTPASEIVFPPLKAAGAGSGWSVYRDELTLRVGEWLSHIDDQILPRAATVVQLAENDFNNGLAVPVEQAMPVYLRDKVAKKESER